eukprot:m.1628406 g.1628406  ORF g.1628406 m.1628406 type:complete len:117 (-) comp25396_c0_seq70:6575-6925(-)
MRDCHAKLYDWSEVMRKLVKETEQETHLRRESAKKATVHPGLEPLEAAQQVPLLEILAQAARTTDASQSTATIARHRLVELLNSRCNNAWCAEDAWESQALPSAALHNAGVYERVW